MKIFHGFLINIFNREENMIRNLSRVFHCVLSPSIYTDGLSIFLTCIIRSDLGGLANLEEKTVVEGGNDEGSRESR